MVVNFDELEVEGMQFDMQQHEEGYDTKIIFQLFHEIHIRWLFDLVELVQIEPEMEEMVVVELYGHEIQDNSHERMYLSSF